MPVVPAWKTEVQKLMNQQIPVAARTKKIITVLLLHGKAWFQKLSVDVILPHIKNRSGRILVVGDVHAKGAIMASVGADIDLLKGSVCWELPEEPERAVVLQKIQDLVTSSDGFLAPINGSERYMSSDASHTTAFCKAVKHGCKTNVSSVKDKDGNLIPASSIQGDMEEMCSDEGWEWTVISRDVAKEFPHMVDQFQRGLNAKHAAVKRATEIEVARSLVVQSEYMSINDAILELQAEQPLCVDYLSKIGKYVELFSGEGQLVKYLDEFTKDIGCASFQLGSDFMTALVDLTSKAESTILPFCRLAAWLAQVSNPKVVDGFCKHLSSGQLRKLTKEDKSADVEALELLLKQGWELGPEANIDSMTQNFTGPARLAYGKYAVRCILHFLEAEKGSREPNGYASLAEITKIYHDDLKHVAEPMKSKKAAAAASTMVPLAATSKTIDVFKQRNPSLSTCTCFTCSDHGATCYIIKDITEKTVMFQHSPLFGEDELQEVTHAEFKKSWRGLKEGNFPSVVSKEIMLLPEHASNQNDLMKARATLAMDKAYQESSAKGGYLVADHLILVCVDEECKFPKGEFKLVAYGGLRAFTPGDKKASGGSVYIIANEALDAKFSVSAAKKVPKNEKDNKFLVSPFFLVGKTDEPDEANMKLTSMTQDGWTIPVLVNTRTIKDQETLLIFRAKPEQQTNKKRKMD